MLIAKSNRRRRRDTSTTNTKGYGFVFRVGVNALAGAALLSCASCTHMAERLQQMPGQEVVAYFCAGIGIFWGLAL